LRYRVTDSGLRIALFFTRTYNRLLRPALAAALPALCAASTLSNAPSTRSPPKSTTIKQAHLTPQNLTRLRQVGRKPTAMNVS